MTPRVEPIMLFGFCFETQHQQRFNQTWACAFHTSWYTDENNAMWDSVDDPNKRREIRYGNNICVLFRVLLHCRAFYNNSTTFWAAISKGFNTSPTVVKQTSEILTQARRAQRHKSSKEVSDTALAADDWIDFLDNQGSHHSRTPADSSTTVYKAADAFFKTQEKKLLNASGVPVSWRSGYNPNTIRLPPRSGADETNRVSLTSEMLAADRYRPASYSRKRSASPPGNHSPKSRRLTDDARQQAKAMPDRHGALDKLPTIQPTRSPPRPIQSLPPKPTLPPSGPRKRYDEPNGPAQPAGTTQPVPQTGAPVRVAEVPKAPAQPAEPARSVPLLDTSARKEGVPSAPSETAHDDSALKERIAGLEKQLAEAKSKLASKEVPATPTTAPPSKLREDVAGLKSDMKTATNAISTMMESMHDIVDSLNSLQEEVSSLSAQQKGLATAVSQPSSNNNSTNSTDFDFILQPIQALTKSVSILQADLVELKAAQSTAAAATVSTTTQPLQTKPDPDETPAATSTIEGLLQAQNTRMDKLLHELASLQQQSGTGRHGSPPQTLRQAMAAAEQDLRHHLGTLQAFYHRGGASRALTERTADFMAVLDEGVRVAHAGQMAV